MLCSSDLTAGFLVRSSFPCWMGLAAVRSVIFARHPIKHTLVFILGVAELDLIDPRKPNPEDAKRANATRNYWRGTLSPKRRVNCPGSTLNNMRHPEIGTPTFKSYGMENRDGWNGELEKLEMALAHRFVLQVGVVWLCNPVVAPTYPILTATFSALA